VKKIVVIGTGRMGGAFATAFAKRTSHAVSIRGSHAGSSSAAALGRQLGVRVADDKELLAADHPAAFNAELFEAIPAIRSFQDFVNELAP
jgi:predicted dinucleotide-binding enzyme